MTKRIALLLAIAAAALAANCARDNGEPDPPTQVLVPCDKGAAPGDPEACPPADARVDAPRDAGVD